mmetsp:Transcript_54374/g.157185  ORF Transcript_54374/g.157185 Transcript_54374/m.157185 type:complete len:231 (+) Transcript_54374:329-1021(+)
MSVLLGGGNNSVDKHLGLAFQFIVDSRLAQLLHSFDTGSHGQGVSRQSTGLVHRTSRGNHLHDILAASVGTDGKTSSDDLSHGGDIGGNSEVLLGSSVGDTESSHDFVEDQKSTVVLGQLTDSFQEFLVGLDESRVSDDRLQDDGSNFVLVVLEDLLHGLQVVVFGAISGLGGRSRDTRRVRKTQSGDSRSGLDQERVGVSVVASLELDDLFAVGESTDQTDHTHACFSS